MLVSSSGTILKSMKYDSLLTVLGLSNTNDGGVLDGCFNRCSSAIEDAIKDEG